MGVLKFILLFGLVLPSAVYADQFENLNDRSASEVPSLTAELRDAAIVPDAETAPTRKYIRIPKMVTNRVKSSFTLLTAQRAQASFAYAAQQVKQKNFDRETVAAVGMGIVHSAACAAQIAQLVAKHTSDAYIP